MRIALLRDDGHIKEEMLVSYLLNEADDAARQEVEQWIIESQQNRKYFEQFRTIWEASLDISLPPSVDEHAAWERFKRRTEKKEQNPRIVRQMSKQFNWIKIAATVVGMALLLTLTFFMLESNRWGEITITAAAKPKTNILPDGSVVTLNKNSNISYTGQLEGATRDVRLEGEAFFSVSPNADHPFNISTGDVTVTVLGTAFNVKNTDDGVEVVVEIGKVKVSRDNASVILSAGERTVAGAGQSSLVVESGGDRLYTYYRTNEFVCDDTPLWKLVEVLNEAYGVDITIASNELRNLPLTTTFHNQSLDSILNVIGETFNITVERQGNKITLK